MKGRRARARQVGEHVCGGALLCCRDSDRSLESMRFAERAVSLRCLGRIGRGREDVRKRGGRREDGLKVEEQQGQTDRQSRSRLRSKEHPARRWKNEGRQVRRGRYEHVGRSGRQVRSGLVRSGWLASCRSYSQQKSSLQQILKVQSLAVSIQSGQVGIPNLGRRHAATMSH